MNRLFFSSSKNALDQITNLYDFIWPTASSMWNLRWQIRGFISEVGQENVTENDLLRRFDWGSQIHGVNLKKAYIDHSWSDQQENFAKILLTNLFSIYEGWLADIQITLNIADDFVKDMQFTTRFDRNNRPVDGIRFGIQNIQIHQSIPIRNAFYNQLCNNRKYSLIHLDNLLKCYRFFKEVRNCYIHHGGIVDQRLENAYHEFQPVATVADLGLKEVPNHIQPIINNPIQISLRGVVGIGDVIIRIITTLDAEFSVTQIAESEIISRCQEWVDNNPHNRRLRDIQRSQEERTISLLNACDFPRSNNVAGIYQILHAQGLIR